MEDLVEAGSVEGTTAYTPSESGRSGMGSVEGSCAQSAGGDPMSCAASDAGSDIMLHHHLALAAAAAPGIIWRRW